MRFLATSLLAFLLIVVVPQATAQVPSPNSDLKPWGVHVAYGPDPTTSMTVQWLVPRDAELLVRAASNAALTVQYGETTAYGKYAHSTPRPSSDFGAQVPHVAFLTGLAPNTTYHYRIGGAGIGWSPDHTFTTAPVDQTRFTVTVYGDQGTGRSVANQPALAGSTPAEHPSRRVVTGSLGADPDLHLHVGDLSYDDWDEWQWIIEPLAARVPYMVAAGNHDIDEERNIKEYDARLVMPAQAGLYHYAFTFGHARFIALDSENWCVRGFSKYAGAAGVYYGCDDEPRVNEVQLEFLRTELANARQDPDIRWVVPFFHRPVLSDGRHGSHSYLQQHWRPLFDEYKPELVLAGHDHLYERSKPVVNNTPATIGTTYLVTGGGGHGLYDFQNETPPDWEAARAKAYHYVVLRFDGDNVTGTAYDIDGKVLDEFTLASQADTWNTAQAAAPVPRMPFVEAVPLVVALGVLAAVRRRKLA